jgi:hypothetical protein
MVLPLKTLSSSKILSLAVAMTRLVLPQTRLLPTTTLRAERAMIQLIQAWVLIRLAANRGVTYLRLIIPVLAVILLSRLPLSLHRVTQFLTVALKSLTLPGVVLTITLLAVLLPIPFQVDWVEIPLLEAMAMIASQVVVETID